MSESSAYRNQARRCCYASAEGGDLALPLELGGFDIVLCGPIRLGDAWVAIAAIESMHSAHLPAALQLHLISHLHLAKAVI